MKHQYGDGELEGVSLNYIVRDWTVFSGMSIKPGAAKKPKGISLFAPSPPRTELQMKLVDRYRTIRIRNGDETTKFEGEFGLRIVRSEEGVSEGAVQHAPAWSGGDEALYGGIAIPKDQFDWLLGELEKPNAYLSVWLNVPMLEGEALPYDNDVTFFGFTLSVFHGPGAASRIEPPAPQPSPAPPPAPQPRDERLTWIVWLLAALVGLAGYIANRLSQ